MDEIVNLEDEEIGLSLWGDYGCVMGLDKFKYHTLAQGL